MIEAGLVALLSANTPLTNLIGTRLYPVMVPEEATYPCLAYATVSSGNYSSLDNKFETKRRIQFEAYSTQYIDCLNVQLAVRNALAGLQATLTDGTRVLSILPGVSIDDFDSANRTFRAIREYIVLAAEI